MKVQSEDFMIPALVTAHTSPAHTTSANNITERGRTLRTYKGSFSYKGNGGAEGPGIPTYQLSGWQSWQ